MSKLRALWRNGRGLLFVVLVGIAFYEMLEHFSSVRAVISRTTSVLMPILCGLMVAYIINIPATILQGTLFKKAHAAGKKYVVPLTVVLSYLIVFGILTAVLVIVIPKAVDSVKILFDNFETYYNSAAKWATEFWEGLNLSDEVTARAVEISNKILDNVEVFTTNLAPKLLGYTFNAVSTVADILLALAFSIYAILDKNRLLAHSRRFVRSVFNEKHSSGILEVFSYANLTFRGYFAGQITSCTIIGILCYIGMRIMNMPFPEMISVFIAVFAMIPILGPWLSTIPSAFIILMTSPGKPELVLYFVIMIIIIQQIDNNLVYPRVVGDAVGLSSAWVLGAVILGSGLFGIAGLIFAVPVTAVLYRLLADWTNERARQRGVPIIDTVPGVKYDLRGHVRRSFKKKKNNASPGSGKLRTKATKTETRETAVADKAGRTEKSENENSDNK